jgi:hypothetical protein
VTRHYLVPWYDVPWDELVAALGDLGAESVPPEAGVMMSWHLGGSGVHLFEEGVEQLVVDGDDADRVAALVRSRIRTYGPEDLPAVFDDGIYLWDRKLALLAAVAPSRADPALVELFRRGFGHDNPHVRTAAVVAAAVPAWPELRPDVERLATADPVDSVRDAAALVLAELDG